MAEHLHAYNSLWQVRGDSWCRLDEAADRLARPTTTGPLKDKYAGICRELLNQLTSLEHYWAYPGAPLFARLQRLFAVGSYDKFAHAVARINRALTSKAHRVLASRRLIMCTNSRDRLSVAVYVCRDRGVVCASFRRPPSWPRHPSQLFGFTIGELAGSGERAGTTQVTRSPRRTEVS
jgi:hypothetical protein